MIGASPRDPVYLEAFNNTGSTLAAYHVVYGARESVDYSAAVDSIAFGIVAQDIADQTYGNVQVGGVAVAMAGTAGMTAGALVMAEAGGTGLVVDLSGSAGDNKYVLGRCEKTAASGKLGEVRWAPALVQIAD